MNCFTKDKQKVGRTWAWGFLKRFLHLTCRKARNLSVVRAMAANKPNVHKWFVEYEKVLSDLRITSPVQIWSSDETGMQNIPKEEKVICVKHKPATKLLVWTKGNIYGVILCKWCWELCACHCAAQGAVSTSYLELGCASRSVCHSHIQGVCCNVD